MLLVANDSFSKCALEPITIAVSSLTIFGSVTALCPTKSVNAVSSLFRSSNLDAPSASANKIIAPLELCIPCRLVKVHIVL